MKLLYLCDRLSLHGGADQHLLQVIQSAAAAGHAVRVAHGRADPDVRLPPTVDSIRLRGLARAVADGSRLGVLDGLVASSDLVHIQNVMNPVALEIAVASGRAVVTVQDHRVFCPAMGKTLPDGSACTFSVAEKVCAVCLPEPDYRSRALELTGLRREAIRGARPVVLSRYMAKELTKVGLEGAEVLPPWVEPHTEAGSPGSGFLVGGRLVRHKGVLDAWRAWRSAATGMPLRVAGHGPLADQLPGAEHLGWLAADVLRQELRRARALLFPAFWQEPFGILGVQALAEGTPVVVADVGGTGEWSDAGCLRVPAGDPQAMATAIRRLADDPKLALRLGAEGRTMVAERFSRSRLEPRLHALYESAAQA